MNRSRHTLPSDVTLRGLVEDMLDTLLLGLPLAACGELTTVAQLPAVRAERVVTLDRIGYPGLRGQRALLDALVAALAP